MSSEQEIKSFLLRQVDLWNEGDHDGFVDAHRAIAPNGFSVENPVGSTPQVGWDALEELWTNYQAITKLAYATIITMPNGEAAVLEEITATVQGHTVVRHSLHTYDFADGQMKARYYVMQTEPSGDATRDRLRDFLTHQVEAWNVGDRETCLNLYKEISGGDVHLEYPLGSEEVSAWPFLDMIWKELQSNTRLTIDHLATADNGEAALFVRNVHVNDGVSDENISIEVYRLADDGLHIRYFSQAQSAS
ncbi:MAG: hypothetical protein JWM76_2783 [Pseudonocardiales bacterium]|nr:hypothetical protein [Pseudonocardiales bacterium]